MSNNNNPLQTLSDLLDLANQKGAFNLQQSGLAINSLQQVAALLNQKQEGGKAPDETAPDKAAPKKKAKSTASKDNPPHPGSNPVHP